MFRKILLSVAILLLSVPAFAEVTAEVISYKIDGNGNIEVHTQYKVDGVEVVSRYPLENGKYYWVTRYDAVNFGSMTDAEIKQHILDDLKRNAEGFIARDFIKEENAKIVSQRFESIELVGSLAVALDAKILIADQKTGVAKEEWTVKTDGTKTVKDMTP